ncbi:PTS sugar transporter subunit IIB [Rubrobacter taiwanensis]|jgi:PTS system ascorbate-specific IIB component|uniref:PTS sugar transporter subunit IIB n=1 Tax=Rubrobacter taiwanensis TaxID=185139 RepID=A0A4R1BCR3_9ACTN|nr:PTS sugar transporter subunit IIB [Rubrobacter taiwanensis]TCJ14823.1 PTS sugar transporter subunit IIB [Rubrobacter taiwanensis]
MAGSEPLRVLTVCGVGMGSSLMLRMTAESALQDLGVSAKVEATDASSARSMQADVIIGQGMHTEMFEGAAPVVLTVSNFMDKEALKSQLAAALKEQGWL